MGALAFSDKYKHMQSV